jgi:hypothetical protein
VRAATGSWSRHHTESTSLPSSCSSASSVGAPLGAREASGHRERLRRRRVDLHRVVVSSTTRRASGDGAGHGLADGLRGGGPRPVVGPGARVERGAERVGHGVELAATDALGAGEVEGGQQGQGLAETTRPPAELPVTSRSYTCSARAAGWTNVPTAATRVRK